MAGAIMNKVLDFLGVEQEEYDDYDVQEENNYQYGQEEEEEETREKKFFGIGKGKVVNMAQTQQVKMVVFQVTSFEQSETICNMLKQKQSVIVSLEYVNKDVARRIVDFISGSVHALDGHIQKVSNAIFVVAPFNYEISNELAREEIKSKLSVSWLKNNNNNGF
ncbi:MAG: cell division protein SepF [Clostridia bacterium]|nr:cell division protein SepF [Clostridia bacterium]